MAVYTAIDDPSAHFQTALHTGTGSSNAITNDGNSDLQPDLLWQKVRSHTGTPVVYDSTRGNTKQIETDDARTESTQNTMVSSFDSDGFTMGTDTGGNQSDKTYVTWQWVANGGTRTTNSESGNNPAGGYQANTTAGFSVVDYTGTGATGTMAHGLGAVPDCIIIKNRDVADNWAVYHSANTSAPATDYFILNTTAATADDAAWWNDTAPTSSVFTINTDHSVNADGENYIAYVWTEIQGYSRIGYYEGNGNADGPFIWTGFKPAWLMTKSAGVGEGWVIRDNQRNTYNVVANHLRADGSTAESTSTGIYADFLSNGFKMRATDAAINESGTVYIYMAFAESPFVTSTGIPATAR